MDKPIKKFRSGAIEAAVWLNAKDIDGTRVEFKTASLRRSWKDKKNNEWHDETIHIRKTDLPKLLVVLNELQRDFYLDREKNNE